MKSNIFAKSFITGLAALGFSGSLLASGFEFNLSDDSVYGKYTSTDELPVQFGAGYLYHEGGRNLFNLDLHAQNTSSFQGQRVHTGIGFKTIGYKEHGVDGLGVGLGGFGEMELSQVPGLSLSASGHYAPSILTFSDTDNFTWLEAAANYQVMPNADVQVGYRYVEAGFDHTKDRSVESTGFLGFRFHF
ncbi:YfaZ family outer membrane protein [Litoribacillus peritrichatus]|uniref:YfaZ n=1 Tax=Litoribacillus peritrichatus TaxID=718191 RepID=A0ABP7MLL9_9GAMM